jgi:isopenicillin-N epimerase
MVNRRGFLSSFAGAAGAASALGLPPKWEALLEGAGLHPGASQEQTKLPERALYDSNEEAYWTEMRKQFLIPADEVYLKNGTVGSCPMPVLRAVFDGYYDTEKMAQSDPEDYPIWGYGPWNEFRDPLAEFVGCTRDEIALVRNATEANSYVANGLDMQPGDEVLMTTRSIPAASSPGTCAQSATASR